MLCSTLFRHPLIFRLMFEVTKFSNFTDFTKGTSQNGLQLNRRGPATPFVCRAPFFLVRFVHAVVRLRSTAR